MTEIVCSNCQFNNPHGALFCQKCFDVLVDTVGVSETMTLLRKPSTVALDVNQLRQKRVAEARIILKKHSVAFYVDTEQTPIVALVTKQVILGRGVSNDDQLRVDLTSYSAADKGVSRRHVVLKRTEAGTLTVEDMGSVNGTWLNDTLLQPYRAAPLNSGDELRLSKLIVGVYLP